MPLELLEPASNAGVAAWRTGDGETVRRWPAGDGARFGDEGAHLIGERGQIASNGRRRGGATVALI